ncbi:unnamed protein product [Cunninghamella blakesleeana]
MKNEEDNNLNQVQEVKGFEDNKVTELNPKEETPLPTIAPIENADWRAMAKKNKQRYIPKQAQQQPSFSAAASNSEPEILSQSAATYGLQVPTKTDIKITSTIEISQDVNTSIPDTIEKDEPPKTLEAQAIEAIIKESIQTEENDEENDTLVIPMDETEAFRNDVKDRAEDTTIEDYEKMPVEEFGAALLRGLGWKKGEGIGRNRKNITPPTMTPIKQRESLLGLGAKPQDTDSDNGKKNHNKGSNRKSQYEYKDSSLFKKITKRRADEETGDKYDRSSPKSSSSSNRDNKRYYDDKRSSSSRSRDHSNERSSSSRSREHSTERRSSSNRENREYRDYNEKSRSSSSSSSSRSRDNKYNSRSSSDQRSRSKSPRRHSSGRSSKYS